jgi:hypothetical protein
LFIRRQVCKLGGEITSAREDFIMVANHPGMSDQTNSNIARDGAAKRTQATIPVKTGMKDQTDASKLRGISPESPGFSYAPDASSPNSLDPSPKRKKFGDAKASWGMRDANGQSVNGELGHRVLAEATNLGR